jgi:hypothetical protein
MVVPQMQNDKGAELFSGVLVGAFRAVDGEGDGAAAVPAPPRVPLKTDRPAVRDLLPRGKLHPGEGR